MGSESLRGFSLLLPAWGDILILLVLGVVFWRLLSTSAWLRTAEVNVPRMVLVIGGLHVAASLAYIYFIMDSAADARVYYRGGRDGGPTSWLDAWGLSTDFIVFLVYPLRALNISFLGCMLLFSVVGLLGFWLLLRLWHAWGLSARWLWMLLLPGVHFWTSMIGKDPLLFFAVAAVFYVAVGQRHGIGEITLGVGALLLAFMVRPHIALCLLGALGLGFCMGRELFRFQGLTILAGAVAAAVIAVPIALQHRGIDDLSELESRLEEGASLDSRSQSSIDMSGYSWPMRIGSFLARPLFVDARNGMMLVASIENVVWIVLAGFILFRAPWSGFFTTWPASVRAALFYCILSSTLLGLITNNLGLAQRQKTQIYPALVILAFWTAGMRRFDSLRVVQRLDSRRRRAGRRSELAGLGVGRMGGDLCGAGGGTRVPPGHVSA